MTKFWRAVYSWRLIFASTAMPLVLLAISLWLHEIRDFTLAIGWLITFTHFGLSVWLWRDYMYGNADFDSESSYAPSGMSKSYFMMGSFIILLIADLVVTIIDIEGYLFLPIN